MLPSIGQYAALFVEVGNLRLVPQFTNVPLGSYWSGTEASPGVNAWLFIPSSGLQTIVGESKLLFAVAVRPADAAAVPEPQSLALVLLALSGGAVAWRRRPR